jgi:CxxC-x17-CxxC domain-containing protein
MAREFRDGGHGGFGRDRGRSGGFGGNRGRDRDFRPREMFDAVCGKCGNSCQVPFKPTGNKPVLCSNCFSKDDSGNRFSGTQSSGNSKQLEQINSKLDKILAVLKELELDVDYDIGLSDESEDDSGNEEKNNNEVIVNSSLDEDSEEEF